MYALQAWNTTTKLKERESGPELKQGYRKIKRIIRCAKNDSFVDPLDSDDQNLE